MSIVKVDTKNKGDTAVKEVESDTDSDASDSERTDVEKEESVPKNQTTPTASGKVFCFYLHFYIPQVFVLQCNRGSAFIGPYFCVDLLAGLIPERLFEGCNRLQIFTRIRFH